MLVLKDYQQRVLDSLRDYFKECVKIGNADTAFYEITRQVFGTGIPYRKVDELPGLPYICLRIPTGGGKTLVACHSISIAANDLMHTGNPVVLWLVPSNTIREQTLEALKDKSHPYRQALDSTLGSVTAISVQEALYVQRATLNTDTTVIVATMQAFRIEETDGRKVYDQSGALMEHFSGLDPVLARNLERYEDGKPVPSLANVLKLRRPIIIVDEAHNARTALSFETLARFNPSCIIEFTATPDTTNSPSNVLHSVSAAELKADQMIKMPIRLETRPNWKELLGDAISLRNHLEEVARLERQSTGEYIRPIMLLQAQSKNKEHETLTVEVVEKCLLEDYNIPEDQIRRATGSDRGIDGLNLSEPNCNVRYIITVQALREGWDCPFAYVLCSVAEMRSSTAVEQILGRIMRLPKAMWKQHGELNMAYAFSASQNFIEAANALEDALVQNGFNRQEAREFISQAPQIQQTDILDDFWGTVTVEIPEVPQIEAMPEDLARKVSFDEVRRTMTFTGVMEESERVELKRHFSTLEGQASVERVFLKTHGIRPEFENCPANRGEIFTLPLLAIRQGDLFELFEETHFLDIPWQLSKCRAFLDESEYSPRTLDGQLVEIDVNDKGMLARSFIQGLNMQMDYLEGDKKLYTIVNLAYWLDRKIPHKDITPTESGLFLTRLISSLVEERGFSVEQLFRDKYRLREAIEAKMQKYRSEAHLQAYQALLLPDCETPLTVTPEVCFSYDPLLYPYNKRYEGKHRFKKHYYSHIGDLLPAGEEHDCAVFIDSLPEVKLWVRNLSNRSSHSFWLQTSTDKFYPDFVCLLNDGRYLVVEYKGEDRWSNDDSKEKRLIGELWEKRSEGNCLFVMPKGKDLEAIRR